VYNQISVLPRSFASSMPLLSKLELTSNLLTEMPAVTGFENSTQLRFVDLSFNRLTNLNGRFRFLVNLSYLYVSTKMT
jgi:Leucine-rich repeat (LRR) protein